MDSMEGASKLTLEGWLLGEEREIERTINCLRHRLGTYRAETDKTYNFLEGYLSAIKLAMRQKDN